MVSGDRTPGSRGLNIVVLEVNTCVAGGKEQRRPPVGHGPRWPPGRNKLADMKSAIGFVLGKYHERNTKIRQGRDNTARRMNTRD